MSDLVLFVYFLDIVEALEGALTVVFAVLFVFSFFLVMDLLDPDGSPLERVGDKVRKSKRFWLAWIATGLLFVFTPSKETLMMMGGVHYGHELVKTTAESPIVQKSLKVLESKLDEELKKLESKYE